MSDWVRRLYNPDWDKAAISYLWLKSYCHSRAGMMSGATNEQSKDELKFIQDHRPLVEWCLEHGRTELICDPERAEPTKDGDPIVWAFACTTDHNIVHYALAKRTAVKARLSGDMLTELLGDRLRRRCIYTFDQVELTDSKCNLHGIARPTEWRPDPTWLAVRIGKQ